jgi:hypothetical protein
MRRLRDGLRRLRDEAPIALGSPEAPAFLMAAARAPQPDCGFRRIGLRQFGRHRPGAALGALFEEGVGFDHGGAFGWDSVEFLFVSALLAS